MYLSEKSQEFVNLYAGAGVEVPIKIRLFSFSAITKLEFFISCYRLKK